MDTGMGVVGGFVLADEEFGFHQNLSSASYVFSASAPPFESACSIESINIMEKEPERIKKLQDNARYARETLERALQNVDAERRPYVYACKGKGNISPMIHIRMKNESDDVAGKIMSHVQQNAIYPDNKQDQALLVFRTKYFTYIDNPNPKPSIRVCVTEAHTHKHIDILADRLKKLFENAISSVKN